MAHNIKILFSFTWNVWWQNIDELQVVNLLKELFIWNICSHIPMLVNFTYWVISPPPPLISPYRYIRGIIGVETHGRQQLLIILWNWGVYYDFYGIKLCTRELFWGCFVFGGLELWHLWWDFRLLVSFI